MKTYKLTDKVFSPYKKLSLSYILKSFLDFSKFEPHCSYKLYSYKKVCRDTMIVAFPIFETSQKHIRITLLEKYPYLKFLCAVFFCIWTEYEEIFLISPYSARMGGNADQKNSEYGHF